ncbi:MAG: alpha/beta hydrolase [Bacteroidota bacterium]
MCKACYYVVTYLFAQLFLMMPCNAQVAKDRVTSSKDAIINQSLSDEGFVLIQGIQQWVTIKGDRSKPVILFLHGGPGSPISPYSDNLYKAWEKDFIIVQWDQRGTGRTFGVTAPAELTPGFLQANPLTLAQMAADGIELSEYLLKHLGKKKIILFGTSWGSALGVTMAINRPDLFAAYVGHSQIVDPGDDLPLYNKVHQMAAEKKDKYALEMLDSLGKPPYARARQTGKLLRIVKKYERANSNPAPDSWFVLRADYDNEKDNQNRSDADDYSFVNYAGDKVLGVKPMRTGINFLKDKLDFKIPVYLIQGEEDLLTPKESTRNYFDNIRAPKKEYFLLPGAAHGFNEAVLKTQYWVFKMIAL